jgi:hypothetical protein
VSNDIQLRRIMKNKPIGDCELDMMKLMDNVVSDVVLPLRVRFCQILFFPLILVDSLTEPPRAAISHVHIESVGPFHPSQLNRQEADCFPFPFLPCSN